MSPVRSASWGAAAVDTAGSKANQRPSERTNVSAVKASAVYRTPLAVGTKAATSAPTAGRKITQETRCGLEAKGSMRGVG